MRKVRSAASDVALLKYSGAAAQTMAAVRRRRFFEEVFIEIGFLLTQFPRSTVLRVFHHESQCGKLIANAVARGPVLLGLRLGAEVEQEVDGSSEGSLALGIPIVFRLKAEDVEDEGGEDALQRLQTLVIVSRLSTKLFTVRQASKRWLMQMGLLRSSSSAS